MICRVLYNKVMQFIMLNAANCDFFIIILNDNLCFSV